MDFFFRFVHHDDKDNHRAVQGFRQGWLMFLSIPLDYRIDFDIANAIATFGKFHHWHQDDEFLDRTLVYAFFPSAALVPRDVVFGNYTILGGVRQTWTSVCYVLTVDFGDFLHHDEDQMLVNGNPHPLTGQLQLDFLNFVIPQYPEIGWNNVPLQPHLLEVGDADFFQPKYNQDDIPHVDHQADVEEEVEQQIDESIILDGSDSKGLVNVGPVNHNVIVNHV
jgi:hypothetical protein